MLKDCLEIFEAELERTKKRFGDSDRLILDEYILADGDYLVVEKNGEIRQCSVRMDKKTRTVERIPVDDKLYERICFYDYHSRLVSMDKPQDTKKVIHSNSYLAFWVKWDSFDNGKLNEEAIDRYFDILKDPREKYKKSQDRKMYDYIAKKIGEVDQKKLEKNREWIKGHIFGLDELELNRKNYLKIFFAEEPKLYVQEEQRYVMTKIFNKNDYNVEIDGQIYGLSNDNLGLNSKKPYLEKKTRKMTIPYLITPEEAIGQRKFFDYLMNKANAGETNIFFDYDEKKIISKKRDQMVEGDFSGYFLKIQKGKELEIHHQDTIVDYKYFLKKKFLYRNVIGAEDREGKYKEYVNRQGLQEIVNEVFYSKWLTGNYFTPEDEMSIDGELKRILIWSREAVFAWLYKGREVGMDRILHLFELMTVNIVSVHDLGKINPNFQSDKMHHKWHEEVKPDPNIGSRHSILSSVFYLDYFLGKINEMWEAKQLIKKSEAEILKDFAYIYSYIISRHHGELKEFSEKWKECIYSSGKHKRNLLL
ncbi:CRISPR-associated endonuclease Cas3'' [Coprococcus comes]|uniref:CRISPR-associated endonuclease Cas3'' n=1 Tax=Coprococcus comes TaxID=410072 RepID=UPI002ED2FD8C